MSAAPRRLLILHSRAAPRGVRQHMVCVIADHLAARGIEVVDVYGTSQAVPADGVLVHVDLSVVPAAYAQFAQRYRVQINAGARDIRKRKFVDGLLSREDAYPLPVIVKSDLNYGGEPEYKEQTRVERAFRRLYRIATAAPSSMTAKSDYRIFPLLAAVPADLFTPDTIVQKLMLETDAGKNLLREYVFLGNRHYENIERSDGMIITEDEHVSCLPFTPHPRLLNLRRRLNLDYGKIDYVLIDGEPFVFDANKTLGLGSVTAGYTLADDYANMLASFADEIERALSDPDYRITPLSGTTPSGSRTRKPPSRFPHAARTTAKA